MPQMCGLRKVGRGQSEPIDLEIRAEAAKYICANKILFTVLDNGVAVRRSLRVDSFISSAASDRAHPRLTYPTKSLDPQPSIPQGPQSWSPNRAPASQAHARRPCYPDQS